MASHLSSFMVAFNHAGGFSDGRLLDRPERAKVGGDGVKYLYQHFVRNMPSLNDSSAPELMQYLSSG
jgi:hypothetical protein